MRILLTGRHIKVTDEIRAYVETKANKLPRFYDRIHEIEVILDRESDLSTAEMIVRTDHKHTFVVKDSGSDTFALVDMITDKMERQLTRHKQKTRNHKHEAKPDFTADNETNE